MQKVPTILYATLLITCIAEQIKCNVFDTMQNMGIPFRTCIYVLESTLSLAVSTVCGY